jgi:hypothetical protein
MASPRQLGGSGLSVCLMAYPFSTAGAEGKLSACCTKVWTFPPPSLRLAVASSVGFRNFSGGYRD